MGCVLMGVEGNELYPTCLFIIAGRFLISQMAAVWFETLPPFFFLSYSVA